MEFERWDIFVIVMRREIEEYGLGCILRSGTKCVLMRKYG